MNLQHYQILDMYKKNETYDTLHYFNEFFIMYNKYNRILKCLILLLNIAGHDPVPG